MISDYRPRTAPYSWQLAALEYSTPRMPLLATAPYCGVFLDPRMGKSKVALDRTALLYRRGAIDALLIIAAPKGVHRAWVVDEVPTHLSEEVPRLCLIWEAGKHAQLEYGKRMEELLTFDGLAVLSVNWEALQTDQGRAYLRRFFAARRAVHFVGDETSLWARNVGKRMKTAQAAAQRCPYRTILDGTPEGESPLDYYAQLSLLSKDVLGHSTRTAFNAHYAEWEDRINGSTGARFQVVKRYRNLDELSSRLRQHCFRATWADWRPDGPQRVYQKVYFQLSDQQRAAYDRLRDDYELELAGGDRVVVSHVLTRYLRLQQVTSGNLPPRRGAAVCPACDGEGCERCDGLGLAVVEEPAGRIPGPRPRLEALRGVLSQRGEGPFVVWARFTRDVDDALELVRAMGLSAVRFDGLVPEPERLAARAAFQEGRAEVLVGKPVVGGRGVPLHRANTLVYYSNDYSRLTREQSELRGIHPSRTRALGIVDLLAEDTVDEDIVATHRAKQRLADLVMDRGRSGRWLR